MFHSPKKLRSGSKVRSVQSDKPVSTASSTSSLDSVDMPPKPDKATDVIDPAVIAACVNKHLASDDFMDQLLPKIYDKLRTVVEEAVRAALLVVNRELSVLKEEVKTLTATVEDLGVRLADRTDELEQYQRRNNLRIFGIEETAGEDTDSIIADLCRGRLGVALPPEAICRSHRVGGPPKAGPNGEKRHRPIIVRFTSYRHRAEVYKAKKKLKGSKTTIREDLTARRLEVFRSATSRHGIRNTWTQDGRVLWVDRDGKKGMATRPDQLINK